MACTVAVEDTIIQHYNDQIRELLKVTNQRFFKSNFQIKADPVAHAEMIELLKKFRDEEQEHHDIGLEEDAELAPAYELLTFLIKQGCKIAINVSEKI